MPQAPVIVDICLAEDHALDPRVIPGAVRMPFAQAATHVEFGRHHPCVIVCQKGLKLSQGVAAALRSAGREASYLEGGMVGWAEAGLTAWPTQMAPQLGVQSALWVLSDQPCPQDLLHAWGIARFVDPAARWAFVQRDQLANVAQRFDAGDVDLAAVLMARGTPFRARFQALHTHAEAAPVVEILNAHCNFARPCGKWLEQIFPMFDAMWACADEAAA